MWNNEYTYKAGYNGTLQERMDSKTKKTTGCNCWEWTGALDTAGYATIRVGGRLRRASHIAYELNHCAVPKGMIIMHKCDNRKCVNPKHLVLGTSLLNSQDKISKNRGRWLKNESHPRAKLTALQVKEIRDLYATNKISYTALGKIYDVDRTTIKRIINYAIWR